MEKLAELMSPAGGTLLLVKEGGEVYMLYNGERYAVEKQSATFFEDGMYKLLGAQPLSCSINPKFGVIDDGKMKGKILEFNAIDVTPQAPFYDLKKMTGLDILEDEQRGITRGDGGIGWTKRNN